MSAVLLDSTKPSVCSRMLSAAETSQIEYMCAALEPLAQTTIMLCSKIIPSLSLVQLMLAVLLQRHQNFDTKIGADMKVEITQSIEDRQKKMMLIASELDPHFKASEQDYVFLVSSCWSY